VLLAGRYAGKKAILIKANEEATKVIYNSIGNRNQNSPMVWWLEFKDIQEK
jgi:ribosomal protein L14E/L6E/L27E